MDPADPERVVCTLDLTDLAIATSGTSARGMHIWNGAGDYVNPLASMSVIGPELKWADAFATTAFVMGIDGVKWVERFEGYHAIAVTHAGEVLAPAWTSASHK